MAASTLNVNGVVAVGFPVDTTITAPDGEGGTEDYIALANQWYGVPKDQGNTMAVDPAGIAMCMTSGKFTNYFRLVSMVQVMTVDEVRTSIAD